MIWIILIIVFVLVFMGLPIWAKCLVMIANMFIPDPIPFVDEIFMIASTLSSIKNRN